MRRQGQTLGVLALTIALAAVTLGCHTMRFEVGSGTVSEVVYERKAYFLGGLFPTRDIDVLQHCPDGAVAIREETRFSDGLLNFITLSIYSPRSTYYHCAEGVRP